MPHFERFPHRHETGSTPLVAKWLVIKNLDTEIRAWAREYRYIVFTNDLDYGALLFATAAASPIAYLGLHC